MRNAGNAGPKSRQKFVIWAPSHNFVGLYLRNQGKWIIGKKAYSAAIPSPHVLTIMANFASLTAEIGLPVWGTLANFDGFCALAALLHGTPVVDVSQTLRR